MINGQWMYISTRETGHLNWHRPNWILVSLTPIENLQQPIKRSITVVMLVALVSTLVFSVFAFFFTTSITRRINSLISGMRKMQTGNLDVTIIPRGSDEISELMADFNYMTKRIGILLEENAKQIDISRRNELIALQSQINPHFLYNTLDLINWTAVNREIPEIYEIVQALSKFYKLSLGQGKNIVSLHDEIQHVCAYMDIQCRRFDNAIIFINTVPESLFGYSIVKLTLQPLVENAIIHGIMKKPVRRGTITITAKETPEAIILQIHDDGAGLENEKLQSIFKSGFSPENGYGLSNVNTRIKLYFGKPYGLNIESISGEYTKVIITLPRITYNAGLF
jgi:two-component system sensor histidine kinase YesM